MNLASPYTPGDSDFVGPMQTTTSAWGSPEVWTQIGNSLLSAITTGFVVRENRRTMEAEQALQHAQQSAGFSLPQGNSTLVIGAGLFGLAGVLGYLAATKRKRR